MGPIPIVGFVHWVRRRALVGKNERSNWAPMRRVQAAELRHDEEQKAPDREIRHQEVLSWLSQPYGSQGSEGLTATSVDKSAGLTRGG